MRTVSRLVGYLAGGVVPAVLLPSATIVLIAAASTAIGIRRRRRISPRA